MRQVVPRGNCSSERVPSCRINKQVKITFVEDHLPCGVAVINGNAAKEGQIDFCSCPAAVGSQPSNEIPNTNLMSDTCFHASIEGAQHGAKSLAQFLDYAKASGSSGAQPSNYMVTDGDNLNKPAENQQDGVCLARHDAGRHFGALPILGACYNRYGHRKA